MLLACGLLLAGGIALYWVARSLLAQRRARYADDIPTQIVVDLENSPPRALLIALDTSLRLPDRIPLYAGREIRLGRDRKTCTVVLNDVGISRRHATIFSDGQGFSIRDERSRGGTFVNRRKLTAERPQPLQHDDTIQFYTFAYRYTLADAQTQSVGADTIMTTV